MRDGRPDLKVVWRKMIVLLLVVSLSFGPFCFAQGDAGPGQEIDNFSLVQYKDGGGKKWELNGRSAEVGEDTVKINEVSALLFGKESSLKVKARQGSFDRVEEIVQLDDDVVARATDGTMITCDGPLVIDYKKNKATFQNNVKVKDVQGDIFADRIDVYFNKDTRRIRLVVARGNVRIVNEGNVTYSEKAIYLVGQGRVVLPKRPRLVIQSTD